jgi:hypothetical protein
MHIQPATLPEGTRIKPVTAAGIQYNVSAPRVDDVPDSTLQRFRYAEIVKPATCGNCLSSIAGIFRSLVLGLK